MSRIISNGCSRNRHTKPNIYLLTLIISFTYLLSGCNSPSSLYYENPEWNFSLEYPNNWELNDDNRVANDFSLHATKGLLQKSSALILLISEEPFQTDSPTELKTAMENYLDVISKRTHKLRSLEIIRISDVIDIGNHKMIWATISVPTLDIVEGSSVNQMGQQDENITQIIDIYILQNSQGQSVIVEVYKGTDEGLNSEAEEIVKSIQFINK